MAIVVEHEKRKREILEKSFQLFIEDGYEDVTYQKIADKCGITRTTLYIYFKNKREIFLWSIKQLTNDVEQELIGIIKNNQIDSIECLNLNGILQGMPIVLVHLIHKLQFPINKPKESSFSNAYISFINLTFIRSSLFIIKSNSLGAYV